ncbi:MULTISPECIES: c-type cytochrome [Acidobacteriaceae]|uniref:c-type cytochrome n=1 Tax=Acidobacteriaceae TaxID=204434 RepID=UPI00131D6D80|nr:MULTISPECIES: c-type cytochrome [Acidobacteriaceae]MDW5265170.1 c-type cytochrome [Edaphobacter sp.]
MRVLSVAITAACIAGLTGCKASPPGKLETKTITYAKHRYFIGNRNQKNPLPDAPETLADGKEAFSHYCAACHGMDAQNTGVPFVDHISPPIPSLASPEVQSYTDGQLKWILDYGIRPSGMPGSKGTLSDDELWSIVVFLRHLPPAGSQGTPDMYTH